MKTLEKTTQTTPAKTQGKKITSNPRETAIPTSRLKRDEPKGRAPRPDQRNLSIHLVIEIHVALQKLATQKECSMDDLVTQILVKAISKISLTADDFLAIAAEVQAATDQAAQSSQPATEKKMTTVEMDAEAVGKLRASLRAIRWTATLEEFLAEDFHDKLNASNGLFESLIQSQDEHRRQEIEDKLKRIRQGDKRLVRREPLPRNALVYDMARLVGIATDAETGVSSVLNAILESGMGEIDRGTRCIGPNTGEPPALPATALAYRQWFEFDGKKSFSHVEIEIDGKDAKRIRKIKDFNPDILGRVVSSFATNELVNKQARQWVADCIPGELLSPKSTGTIKLHMVERQWHGVVAQAVGFQTDLATFLRVAIAYILAANMR